MSKFVALFLIISIFIGADMLQHSKKKIDKLRFTYLCLVSLLSLAYVL